MVVVEAEVLEVVLEKEVALELGVVLVAEREEVPVVVSEVVVVLVVEAEEALVVGPVMVEVLGLGVV